MIVVPCTMFPGGFSSEIGFDIDVQNGKHTGLAPRRYFRDASGEPVEKDSVTSRQPGYIAVRILEKKNETCIVVAIPDGEVVSVTSEQIQQIPEPAPHVPVRS